ncbi:MAG: hypothetical protein ACTSYC_01155 [Promethearchaeota archaeon]
MAKKAKVKGAADVLFVKSKIRDYIKSKGCNTSGDLIDGNALNKVIMDILDKAIARAKANGRKTVQEKDL